MKKVRIVIPAYNEQDRLPKTVNVMNEYLDGVDGVNADILLVNDGSTDDTLHVMKRLSREFSNVHYISYNRNRGKGYAVRAGMLMGDGYDYYVFSDADGSSHLRFIIPYLNIADVVVTDRELKDSRVYNQSSKRKLFSRVFFICRFLLLSDRIPDSNNGLKSFKGTYATNIFGASKLDGFGFDVEALHIAKANGLFVRRVPVVWVNTPDSRVKLFKHSIRMFLDLLRIKFYSLHGDYKFSK